MKDIFDILPDLALNISAIVQEKAGTEGKWTINESWDTQTNIDLITDRLVEKTLKNISCVKEGVSEEKQHPIAMNEKWKYLVAYDSLDGSSVSDVDLTVWTILAIYEWDYLAKNLVGAAYILYWPRLEYVVAIKSEVIHYKYINWKFIWTRLSQMARKGMILSPGSLYKDQFKAHKDFIDSMWNEWYKLRYSGCMVPDVHQLLIKWWGMFCYTNTKIHPWGRLRKLYEVFPFTFILTQLWWWWVDHLWNNILDLWYDTIHEWVSCYLGSKYEVEKAKKTFSQ